MGRKESIEKNMEFLTKELQKEWDVSKERGEKCWGEGRRIIDSEKFR